MIVSPIAQMSVYYLPINLNIKGNACLSPMNVEHPDEYERL
jgi:hypothetical protein